jgi:DNA-binding response OmpR family regulator
MNEDSLNNKILIVDDDKFLIDMYSIKFNENKFIVETASDGKEALKKIDAGFMPDICLVDIIMPEMDGFELVAELKKRPALAKTAIIILSNLGQQDDVTKGMSLGADGYIIKASATPTEVVTKVSEIVSNKKF